MRVTSGVLGVAIAAGLMLGAGGCEDSPSQSTSPATTTTTSATTRTVPSEAPSIPALGATIGPVTAGETGGVAVVSVEGGSSSRLKPGDVITAINGEPVGGVEDVVRATDDLRVGGSFRVKVVRGSHSFTLLEASSPTAYIGAEVQDATGNDAGALVKSVAPGAPAATAGMRPGDLITTFDGAAVATVDDLFVQIGAHLPGDQGTIRVTRGSSQVALMVTLGERPANRPR